MAVKGKSMKLDYHNSEGKYYGTILDSIVALRVAFCNMV